MIVHSLFFCKHFKEMPRKRKSTGGAAPSTQAKRAKKRLSAQSELPLQSFKQPREGMIFYPYNIFITLVYM